MTSTSPASITPFLRRRNCLEMDLGIISAAPEGPREGDRTFYSLITASTILPYFQAVQVAQVTLVGYHTPSLQLDAEYNTCMHAADNKQLTGLICRQADRQTDRHVTTALTSFSPSSLDFDSIS